MRTDRTFVCTDCRVRCWPVRRCPACGDAEALVDLEASPELVSRDPTPQAVPGVAGLLGASSVASGLTSLPLLGVNLPLTKTMILVTFVAGLMPVIGNLISNTVIVVVSLSVSIYAALGSLVFLVAIHKLEYFVNARIIGGQIHARAWELLLAMLVMDAVFGVPGVIAAPIYYAYIKDELRARGLV